MKSKTKIFFMLLIMTFGLLFTMSSNCFAVETVEDWGGTGYTISFGTNTGSYTLEPLYDYNYIFVTNNSQLLLYTSKDILYTDNNNLFCNYYNDTDFVIRGYQQKVYSSSYSIDENNKSIILESYVVANPTGVHRPCFNASNGKISVTGSSSHTFISSSIDICYAEINGSELQVTDLSLIHI